MSNDAKHWQQVAEHYADGNNQLDPALASHIREVNLALVRRWMPELDQPRILKTDAFADATCPARAFSWLLCDTGQLVCYDIASRLAAQGRYNAAVFGRPDTIYVAADARCLPFDDESFDLIVSDSTLDHFHTTEEIAVALREHARVLKPGGVMIVTLDNPHNLTEPLFRLWLRCGGGPYLIGKTLNKSELAHSLARAGLEVTDTTAVMHYPRLVMKQAPRLLRRTTPDKGARITVRLLEMTRALERLPSRYLTGLFIATRAIKPY